MEENKKAVGFHSVDYHLSDLLTVQEVVKALGLDYEKQLRGKYMVASQHNMISIRVGRTLVYPLVEVTRVANERGLDFKVFNERIKDILALRDPAERKGSLEQYYTRSQALKVMGIDSGEGLFRRSDFRGGPVRTAKLGRTRIYNREDVDGYGSG